MSLTDHGRVRKQQFHDRLGILHHRHLHRKLKERFPAAFNTRWTRRHWLHASLFATLGALLATIVPGFSSQLQPASQLHATLPLQLPPLTVRAPGEGAGRLWDVVQVERGQTLGGVFDRMGVPAATMHRILDNPANRDALVRLRPGAELLLMVKPQFEVGRRALPRSGVVTDPDARRDAVVGVAAAALGAGLAPRGLARSGLAGQDGNAEFFLRLRRPDATAADNPAGGTSPAPPAGERAAGWVRGAHIDWS